MKRSRYNVVIIEPSDILLCGLKSILNETSTCSVVGTFSDIGKYQEFSHQLKDTDIIILNPSLISHGKKGGVRSLFTDEKLVALVYNYIDKDTLLQFDESIEIYDKPAKIANKLEQIATQASLYNMNPEAGELSDREREILIAVAKGMMNKEISSLYNISIHTVIAHRKNISRKTGIKSVSGFVVYALLNNLIEEYEVL